MIPPDASDFDHQQAVPQLRHENRNLRQQIKVLQTILQEQELKQKRFEHELESLALLSSALRTAQTRAEMLPLLLEQVMRLINVQGAAIAMRDQASGDSVYEYTSGVLATEVKHRLAEGKGISGQVIASGQPYVRNAEEMDPLFEYPVEAKELHNLACVPLITQKTIIGSLLVERKDKFSSEDVRLLTALADMAASAINRITLFEQTERYAHQMAMAGEIGRVLAETLDLPTIYERLGKSVEELLPDVSHLFISRYNPQEKTFSCIYALADTEIINPADLPHVPLEPPGHGTQSEVIHTHRPVILNNLRSRLPKVFIHVGMEGPITQSGLFVPMLSRGQVVGVVQVQSYIPNRFTQSDVEVLTLVGNTAAVAIDNARLFQDLQRSNQELITAYAATIEGWSNALDMRDQETEGHSKRVTELTLALARKLGYPEDQMENMRRGALLHDIGKMVIPDRILLKPDQLTAEESIVMREHPVYAYDFLSTIAYLRPALAIPYCHHEKWDGSGYPRGIKGVEIPLAARIFAVVDVWDALTSDRPYRPAWSKRRTVEYIRSESGKHFDPQVVNAFVELISSGKSIVPNSTSLNQSK